MRGQGVRSGQQYFPFRGQNVVFPAIFQVLSKSRFVKSAGSRSLRRWTASEASV